jgi:NADH dehydrogenase
MYLVVGATGLLGSSVCTRLRAREQQVRAMVRPTARPETVSRLQDAGVELVSGDLKDRESIRRACHGVSAVISTASSTLSRQEGDAIATVDLEGQLSLLAAAKDSGVRHFTFVSIPRSPVRESPLTRAKYRVERELANSGMPYTVLAANYFMEVWLSPALGFDYAGRKAVVFGDGRQLMSWVSYEDVAEFASLCADTPGAHNRILEIGGPQDLSPLEVIRIFEEAAGGSFEVQHVPEEALLAQLEQATDPLSETFCKLQLEYLHGCLMNTSEALRLMPVRQKTVAEYARQVTARKVAGV